jgi:rhodanese-related sulfurtransferase
VSTKSHVNPANVYSSVAPWLDANGILTAGEPTTVERPTIGDMLEAARQRIDRLTPEQARAEMDGDAVLIDIRCRELREDVGVVPGSLHHPLSVLYWRLDPTSGHADPRAADPSRRVILMCAHGYSSSLAAATLRDLGFERAADVVGGFEAWAAAGLPVEPALNPGASRASEPARPGPSQR